MTFGDVLTPNHDNPSETENKDNAMNVDDPLLRSLLIKDRRAELERLETRSIGLRPGRGRRFTYFTTTAHTPTTKEKIR